MSVPKQYKYRILWHGKLGQENSIYDMKWGAYTWGTIVIITFFVSFRHRNKVPIHTSLASRGCFLSFQSFWLATYCYQVIKTFLQKFVKSTNVVKVRLCDMNCNNNNSYNHTMTTTTTTTTTTATTTTTERGYTIRLQTAIRVIFFVPKSWMSGKKISRGSTWTAIIYVGTSCTYVELGLHCAGRGNLFVRCAQDLSESKNCFTHMYEHWFNEDHLYIHMT
jgi:hypothetical protein